MTQCWQRHGKEAEGIPTEDSKEKRKERSINCKKVKRNNIKNQAYIVVLVTVP